MSVGIRHDDLRRRNRAMVIAAVRRAGQPSRTEIAAHDRPQPFDHLGDLVRPDRRRHACRDQGRRAALARRGRPQVALAAQPEGGDGHRRRAVAEFPVGRDHRLFRRRRRRGAARAVHATMPRDELVAECGAMLRRLMRACRRPRESRCASCSPSRASPTPRARRCCGRRSRRTATSPSPTSWKSEFGIPTTVENDCNMMAIALALARTRSATATTSSPSCCRTASAWAWC